MPAGFDAAEVLPSAAYFDTNAGEFILPYEAVRTSGNPEAVLMSFLNSTYDAAASLGDWDRKSLECDIGVAGKPRLIR
jgi:hypothetical protein